jgi:DNA-binding IclR family transcriptional regulator
MFEQNKTKIARRVIEIFEFFDTGKQRATVMDIVRHYGRPQSSTSELFSSLVDMGLLYKDPRSRFYSLTPRIATLGTKAQPEMIRDGRLFAAMDRLAHSTRNAVALFGMVGTCVQIFRWVPGQQTATRDVGCGLSRPLCKSTAGLLMLAALPSTQSEKILWRLNAEAEEEAKFNTAQLGKTVAGLRERGHAIGPSGFAARTQVIAKLLHYDNDERPLALGMIYGTEARNDSEILIKALSRCVSECERGVESRYAPVPASCIVMQTCERSAVRAS